MKNHGITTETVNRFVVDSGAVYANYGAPGERLLGATRGGATFAIEQDIREIEIDGARGPVKGARRPIEVRARITANLIEVTTENLLNAIAGSITYQEYTRASAEIELSNGVVFVITARQPGPSGNDISFEIRDQLGAQEGVTVSGSKIVYTYDSTVSVPLVNDVLLALWNHELAGELIDVFTTQPGPGDYYVEPVAATYLSGGGEYAYNKITRRSNSQMWYLDNVALVGRMSDGRRCVFMIKNALPDGNFELSTEDRNESVIEVQFTGHFDPANMDEEPWEIWIEPEHSRYDYDHEW